MTNIHRTTIGVVTLMLVGGIACRENASNSAAPAGDDAASSVDARPKVALVMKSLANEFFQTMEDGARAHQAQDPSRYELFADGIKNELDVARQIDLVEQMVARGAQVLVLAPADSEFLNDAIIRFAFRGLGGKCNSVEIR